jgi:hypothetical protein
VRRDTDAANLCDKAPSVVVLVDTDAHLLRHLAIDDQGMVVVHEHMAPVTGECRMGIGFPAQQRVRIDRLWRDGSCC